MRIKDITEGLASQLIKGATKLAPKLSKTTAPAVGQTFNFAHYKPEIVKNISKALESGQPVNLAGEQGAIYNILRNSNKTTVTMVDQLGYTPAQKAAYKSALDQWPKNNGAWAQKDFGPSKAVGQGSSAGGRTENYYATITKDRANLDKFMKSFPDLDQRIQQLAQQTGQPISYKTNANITALAADNDNIKFFYYDPKLKPQIEATVKSWLQANGIATGARTHTHGVDIGKESFGLRISKQVNDVLNNTIKQYGAKYTPEQYYEWLGTHFKQLVSQVK